MRKSRYSGNKKVAVWLVIIMLSLTAVPVRASAVEGPRKQAEQPTANSKKKKEGYTGWRKTKSGKKQYLIDGVVQKGFITIKGKTYYLAGSKGYLAHGQKKIDGYYYYFSSKSGVMARSRFVTLTRKNGEPYICYFNKKGRKVFGMKKINGKYYYFTSKAGARVTGLKKIGDDWYLFSKKGVRQTGFRTIDGNQYYFRKNGKMAFGGHTIDGEFYYFNEQTGVLEWTGRRYQNPEGYYQVQDGDIELSGAGYELDIGSEGLKVRWVLKALGLGNGVGMYASYYSSSVKESVRAFQRRNGLYPDGIVGLKTWEALGYSEALWYELGGYASPNQSTVYSTREDLIEIMIDRAYDYLGDDYVIGASGAPGRGIDCSGLVMQALFAAGIDMSPINPVRHAHIDYEYESRNIWYSPYLKHVSYWERERGDIIIYQNSAGVVIHSAIYLGDDLVIESWPNRVMVSYITASFHPNVKGVLRVFN